MFAQTDAMLDFAPNSPCVAERTFLFGQTAADVLKRALTRFGLPPHLVGFKKGNPETEPGQILIMGRDRATGQPVEFGRIRAGVAWAEIAEAHRTLIDQGWIPRQPVFDTPPATARDA